MTDREKKWQMMTEAVDAGNKIMTAAFNKMDTFSPIEFEALMENYTLMIEQEYGKYIDGFKQREGSAGVPWELELW